MLAKFFSGFPLLPMIGAAVPDICDVTATRVGNGAMQMRRASQSMHPRSYLSLYEVEFHARSLRNGIAPAAVKASYLITVKCELSGKDAYLSSVGAPLAG